MYCKLLLDDTISKLPTVVLGGAPGTIKTRNRLILCCNRKKYYNSFIQFI